MGSKVWVLWLAQLWRDKKKGRPETGGFPTPRKDSPQVTQLLDWFFEGTLLSGWLLEKEVKRNVWMHFLLFLWIFRNRLDNFIFVLFFFVAGRPPILD